MFSHSCFFGVHANGFMCRFSPLKHLTECPDDDYSVLWRIYRCQVNALSVLWTVSVTIPDSWLVSSSDGVLGTICVSLTLYRRNGAQLMMSRCFKTCTGVRLSPITTNRCSETSIGICLMMMMSRCFKTCTGVRLSPITTNRCSVTWIDIRLMMMSRCFKTCTGVRLSPITTNRCSETWIDIRLMMMSRCFETCYGCPINRLFFDLPNSVELENIYRVHIIAKPTNSATQGQPNPRKVRLKVAFGPLFPTATNFSWVGIGFIEETDYEKPNPTTFLRKHPDESVLWNT